MHILLLVQMQAVRLRCLQNLLAFGISNLPDVHGVGSTEADLTPQFPLSRQTRHPWLSAVLIQLYFLKPTFIYIVDNQ